MTQDEMIELAKQAGWQYAHGDSGYEPLWAFANLVVAKVINSTWTQEQWTEYEKAIAAKEREDCAKMADEYATWGGSNFYEWFKKLAADIRARGDQA